MIIKSLFLCILVVNLIFFFLEYRKGAPNIYQRDNYVNQFESSRTAKQITLLSENIHVLEVQGKRFPIVACYLLSEETKTRALFVDKMDRSLFKYEIFSRKKKGVSGYLLLTMPAESLSEAKMKYQEIQQQKIEDVWLFEKGFFKWRISLGLFSSETLAVEAEKIFFRQINEKLDIVPNYQAKTSMYIRLGTKEEKEIAMFEKHFSDFFREDVNCDI